MESTLFCRKKVLYLMNIFHEKTNNEILQCTYICACCSLINSFVYSYQSSLLFLIYYTPHQLCTYRMHPDCSFLLFENIHVFSFCSFSLIHICICVCTRSNNSFNVLHDKHVLYKNRSDW